MMKVLEERKLPITEFYPVASQRTVGRPIKFRGKDHIVISPEEALLQKPELVLFSAGSEPSRQFAAQFAQHGYVVDNSSAWRMEQDVPLVVPEINADTITGATRIIANPNCSTIQLVMVLAPLHARFGIRRVVVSTYQSVTGTGIKAVKQLQNERAGIECERAYPYAIDLNLIPHIDLFLPNGYSKEEMKMVYETRKIMRMPALPLTATTVRVPVLGGHSESVNVEFEQAIPVEEARKVLQKTPGVVVQDNLPEQLYPMPISAQGKDDVFVGRIRQDESVPNGLNLWIVADNLRKGAATNAVQIAEYLLSKNLVHA
jgi:aspartate-semialdehyde dehydrogenase